MAKQTPEQRHAAERRADYVRGLTEERDSYLRVGDKARAKDVDAELARAQDGPTGRTAPKSETT